MSHVMLESVIRMPFEVAMGDYFSRLQFYQRAQQALSELEALQAKLAEQEPVTKIDYFGDTCCPVSGDRLQLKRGTKLYAHPVRALEPDYYFYKGKLHCNDGGTHLNHGAKEYGRPLYDRSIPNSQGFLDSSAQDESQDLYCRDCGSPALHYLVMDNVGYPNKTPICGRCTDEHEYMAREINEHEMRHFGGGYGLVSFHYEPLEVSNKNNHIPDASKMVVPDGWQLVPKTPTHNMVDNAHNCDSYFEVQDIYKAMLAAAPKYTGESK